MDRHLVLGGLSLVVLGVAMNGLLRLLAIETFRADLLAWMQGSYLVVLGGILVALFGLTRAGRPPVKLEAGKASKYFTYFSLGNTLLACAFVLPVLDPRLDFPILITRWPGIYMVAAYFSFVLVGVLGNAAWSSTLRGLKETAALGAVARGWIGVQLLLTEIGTLGLASYMFLGGYVGAALDYSGGGPVTVGIAMEFAVVPSAISIFLIITGEVVGVANVFGALLPSRSSEERKPFASAP